MKGGGGDFYLLSVCRDAGGMGGGGHWEMEEVVVVKGKRQEGGMKA